MEILHTTEILSDGMAVVVTISAIGTLFTGIFGLIFLISGDNSDETRAGAFSLAVCAALIVAIVSINVNTDHITQHKVVITDMDEFDTERYEIVETEGRIFTINEKEAVRR